MKQSKKITQYSSVSKFLHWLTTLLVIVLLLKPIYSVGYHKSIGLTVLLLTVIRIIWIIYAGKPALPKTMPKWEQIFARMVQYSLYVLLIHIPLSGWIMAMTANHIPVYFGLFEVPIPGLMPDKITSSIFKACHNTLAWILLTLVILHILGALKHYFIDKDKVFERMFPED